MEVPGELDPLSFHKLCVHMHVNKTKFERNSSLEYYYHMTCIWKTKHKLLSIDKLDRAQRRAAKIVLKTTDSDAEKNLKWLVSRIVVRVETVNVTAHHVYLIILLGL